MPILSLLASHPQDVLTVLSFVGGLLGLHKRSKKRQAVAAEVSRWASTAAGVVVIAIQHGFITDEDEAIRRGLARFKALAGAAGVDVTPAHESQAVRVIAEATAAAGQVALKEAAERMYKTADAAIKRLEATAAATAKPAK